MFHKQKKSFYLFPISLHDVASTEHDVDLFSSFLYSISNLHQTKW